MNDEFEQYGPSRYWRVVADGYGVRMEPKSGLRTAAQVGPWIAVLIGALIICSLKFASPGWRAVPIWLAIGGSCIVVVVGIVAVSIQSAEQKRGPWFVWNRSTGEVKLDRAGVTLSRSQVSALRWRRIRYKIGYAAEWVGELSVISKAEHERSEAIVLLRSLGSRDIKKQARQLSEMTGIPLQIDD
jgi:hypothetical protein